MTYPSMKPSTYTADQNVHEFSAYCVFGAAVLTSYKGKGFTMVRDNVGIYTITMAQPYLRFIRFPRFTWQKAAGTDVLSTVTTVISTLETTGVFTIKAVTAAGVATEPVDGNIATLDWALTQDGANNDTGG